MPKVLSRFKGIALAYGVPQEHISIFATEAMRKANNAGTMLEAIRAESGLNIQVIAPEVETLFGAMGARSAYGQVKGLFLDLGGGSVQMSYIDTRLDNYETQAARFGKSLPFGAARLSNIMQSQDTSVMTLARNELKDGVLRAFTDLRRQYSDLEATQSDGGEGLDLYLCGGGFRGYGSMLMHNDPIQPYPIPTIGAYSVGGERFRDVSILREVNAAFEGNISGMSKRRRLQFPAIAEVVEALISAIPSIRTVTFCSGGNREGALLMRLPAEIRESTPLSLLTAGQDNEEVTNAIIATLESAVPETFRSSVPTIFSLGIAPLFVQKMWFNQGNSEESNAAFELRDSLMFEAGCPGLTSLARTVLALTCSARWSLKQAPIDKALHEGLRQLASKAHPQTTFWAEYIGTVAAMICSIVPVLPRAADAIATSFTWVTTQAVIDARSLTFHSVQATGNDGQEMDSTPVLVLNVTIPEDTRQSLEDDALFEPFKQLEKQKKSSSAFAPTVRIAINQG